jgi:hypothetical protein
MRKSCSTCLIAVALVCLLNLGPSPAGAYYPILQATATNTSHSVTYSVYNPMTLQNYGSTLTYLGTITNLQQNNGVIVWVVENGTFDYSVNMITFDPALNKFKHASQGPFSLISRLQVMDGVVAYCFLDSSGAGFNYATFDPSKADWQKRSIIVSEAGNFLNLDVTTKEGVVALSYKDEFSDDILRIDIYDSGIGKWFSEVSAYGVEVAFTDPILTYEFGITNSTILMTINHPDPNIGFIEYRVWGYDPSDHKWHIATTTKTKAYFVAQYDGKFPSLVWLTDMSIAGTSWYWDFGNGDWATFRSTYKDFISPGIYEVSQQVTGAYGSDTYMKTIRVPMLKGLPGILPLLLSD